MNRQELLQTNGYWVAKIQIELYNQLSDYMKKHHLNRSQLAAKLGVTKGYVSQILNGDFNHRLSTLVELSLAMGKAPVIQFSDLDKIDENLSQELFYSHEHEPIHVHCKYQGKESKAELIFENGKFIEVRISEVPGKEALDNQNLKKV